MMGLKDSEFVPCLAITPSMNPSHPTLQEKNTLREDTKEVSQRLLRERFPLAVEGIARKDEENTYSDRKERAAYIERKADSLVRAGKHPQTKFSKHGTVFTRSL